jgi:hypothetical protein
MSVTWPAVIKYASADQLVVVDDADEWQIDPELHAWPYREEDRLIDAGGMEYRFGMSGIPGLEVTIEPTGEQVSAGAFREVVERHLAAVGFPEEWLADQLQGIPESQHVRAAVLYVARLARRQESDTTDTEESEEE